MLKMNNYLLVNITGPTLYVGASYLRHRVEFLTSQRGRIESVNIASQFVSQGPRFRARASGGRLKRRKWDAAGADIILRIVNSKSNVRKNEVIAPPDAEGHRLLQPLCPLPASLFVGNGTSGVAIVYTRGKFPEMGCVPVMSVALLLVLKGKKTAVESSGGREEILEVASFLRHLGFIAV